MRETPQALDAFERYWALGDGRSLARVAQECHKSTGLIGRWSREHHWQERLTARQSEESRLRRERLAAAQLAAVESHAKAATRQLAVASRFLHPKAAADSPDWKPTPREIEAASLALDKAIYHHRLALGMPTNITRHDLEMKQVVQEALELQDAVRRILEEHLCDQCRATVGQELRRLADHRRALDVALA